MTTTAVNAWTSYAEKLIDTAHAINRTGSMMWGHSPSNVELLAVILLARTTRHLRGVLILLPAGLLVEAHTLARSCFENLLWIAGLATEGDKFIEMMKDNDTRMKQSKGQRLIEHPIVVKNLDDKEEKLRAWIEESKKVSPQAKLLKPVDVAKIGKIESAYIFYSDLSSDAHPSFDALDRHYTTASIIAEPLPTSAEIEETLNLACLAMHGACGHVNDLLGGTLGGKDLDALTAEYKRLVTRV